MTKVSNDAAQAMLESMRKNGIHPEAQDYTFSIKNTSPYEAVIEGIEFDAYGNTEVKVSVSTKEVMQKFMDNLVKMVNEE